MKNQKYDDLKRDIDKLESRPNRYSLKSLDSQVFETPAVCH